VTISGEVLDHQIRVLVVDEHAGVRHAIATFVQTVEDLELVGEASSGAEAVRRCARTHPDVVLMGIALPDMTGAAATRMILKRWPPIQVLALCTFQEEERVADVLQAGAVGYLLKNVSADEMACAIRSACSIRTLEAR
jgi:two-component system, NarL family, response regulator LiaR